MTPVLSIIIPARREEETICATLDALETSVKTPHETIVVNDFSDPADRTKKVVNTYRKTHPHVRLIVHTPADAANGFASAIAAGVRAAQTPHVVFVMADTCDDPRTIDRMCPKARDGFDVVCGSRYMKGGKKTGGPIIQGMLSAWVNMLLHRAAGIPTSDASNSFKLYRTDMLLPLLAPEIGGVEYSISLVSRAYASGASITDVPTAWTGRTTGSSKFHAWARMPRYGAVIWEAVRIGRKK